MPKMGRMTFLLATIPVLAKMTFYPSSTYMQLNIAHATELISCYLSDCTHILTSLDVLELQNLIPSLFPWKWIVLEFWGSQGRLREEESQDSFMFRAKKRSNHTLCFQVAQVYALLLQGISWGSPVALWQLPAQFSQGNIKESLLIRAVF